jgi:hypothetical protein
MVASFALCGATLIAQQEKGTRSALDALSSKTGWIGLGDVTADRQNWFSGGDPTVDYLTGPFEIIGRQVDRRKPIFPKVGERIRLTARNMVFILDYATLGERRRLDSPTLAERPIQRERDMTGIVLLPGTIVGVRAVETSRLYGQMRAVWARVVPSGP